MKPIFIVLLGMNATQHHIAHAHEAINLVPGLTDEYHLLVGRGNKDENEFKVFFPSDQEPHTLAEIKQMVDQSLSNPHQYQPENAVFNAGEQRYDRKLGVDEAATTESIGSQI